MPEGRYNLALETSGPVGSVTLGQGARILDTLTMPPQQRHRVDLMPTIDHLCQQHDVRPADLAELYVSVGPGSFTGLRIGITTVKILARVTGAKVVAVPTLEVLARNVEPPESPQTRLVVGMNLKKDTLYAGVFAWAGSAWQLQDAPAVCRSEELLSTSPRPLWVLGEPLPGPWRERDIPGVTLLPPELAQPQSVAVWEIGRALAERGQTIDPMALLPLYARPPEAVALWQKRHGGS